MTDVANDTFSRNVMISLGAHAVLLMFIFLRAVFVPSEPIEIRRAIRVDVVGLPAKMPEKVELPPPAPEPKPIAAPSKPEPPAKELPPKVEPKKPEPKAPTVNLDKKKPAPDTKKAQASALDKIKQMSALDKIKEDVAKDAKPSKPTVIAGNQVSQGNSLTGLEKIEYDRYFDDIEGKVRANWSIPQWLAESPLKAQVQILIDSAGYVTKKIIRRSSGNAIFDAKVIEAIEASSPLPAPPDRLRGVLSTGGIILNFPE